MNTTRGFISDPEVLDALRDRADLLAVADAVAATQRAPARRRRVALRAGAIAAVAAAVFVAVATPWERSDPLVTERALAAIGERPVVHALVELRAPNRTVVDLASGQSRPVVQRVEYWYDTEQRRLRVRLTIDDRFQTEYVQGPEGFAADTGQTGPGRAAVLDPGLAGFASRYRDALEDGRARVVGETTVGGRDAVVIRLTVDYGAPPGAERRDGAEEVVVDAADYRPRRFRWLYTGGSASPWWQVLAIESIERDAADFAAPRRSADRPNELTAGTVRTLTPDEAASALDRPAMWPGPSVRGVQLTEIRLERVRVRWREGRETEGRALELIYGNPRDREAESLVLFVGTTAEETPMFTSAPPPAEGELRLEGVPERPQGVEMWFATLRRDGLYVSFRSTSRELVLEAARSLRPIRS